jgi:multidrug resistance efflux pump
MPEVRAEGGPHPSSDTIGPLVQKVGATTIVEIDNLISELQAARNYLKSEADRIQRELTRYTQLSDTASASVKTITQSLGQWRNANDAERNGASEGQVSPPAET